MPQINPEMYKPACAVWELTLACNLRCIHCGSTAESKRKGELTTAESIQLIRDLKGLGCAGIALMGGEPFLRKDWYVLAKEVKEQEMALSIITNGVLVKTNGNLEKLVDLKPDVIGVSIDGATPETHDFIRQVPGSFDQALDAAYSLKDKGLEVSVISSLNKKNVYELDGIKDLIMGKGIGWQIQVVTYKGERFPEELMLSRDEFYYVGFKIAGYKAKYSKAELPVVGAHDLGYHSGLMQSVMNVPVWVGCQAGITNIGIQSNGNIKGCLSMSDAHIEGNIRERSLKDIWFDPELFKMNRQFKKQDLKGYCASCENGETCQGGCIDMAEGITGHAYENPYCFYRIEQEKLNGGN